MTEPLVSILMRSYNEGWALSGTLDALKNQTYTNWELIVIDSGSTDGSTELIRKAAPAHFLQIAPSEYVPGRVLNTGIGLARTDYVICLNADATPRDANWLRPLAETLLDPRTAAVYGRQVPRPDCAAVYASDYERCFGEERESNQWDHFFSMASSGLRKDIWSKRGFLEDLQYSEDEEYTRWCRAQGYRIVFRPESVAIHSHNYTPAQVYRRSYGEGTTMARVWPEGRPGLSWTKNVLLGWMNDLRKDFRFCARHGRLGEWPHAAVIRWDQRRGRLHGFRHGRIQSRTT